jgi:hypothetical protein
MMCPWGKNITRRKNPMRLGSVVNTSPGDKHRRALHVADANDYLLRRQMYLPAPGAVQ